jgi:hypothetical protein
MHVSLRVEAEHIAGPKLLPSAVEKKNNPPRLTVVYGRYLYIEFKYIM